MQDEYGDFIVQKPLTCSYCQSPAEINVYREYCNVYVCHRHYGERPWAM